MSNQPRKPRKVCGFFICANPAKSYQKQSNAIQTHPKLTAHHTTVSPLAFYSQKHFAPNQKNETMTFPKFDSAMAFTTLIVLIVVGVVVHFGTKLEVYTPDASGKLVKSGVLRRCIFGSGPADLGDQKLNPSTVAS